MTISRSICSVSIVLVSMLQAAVCVGQASKPRPVPTAPSASPSFAWGERAPGRSENVAVRPSEAISQKDRQTIQAAWQVLLQKSSILGFNLNQGQWSYQQIVCPLFSRHLALLFASGEQGERSVFSAVIPEGSDENVRVLPILRRGYTPFQPAAISPSTIAEFNAIRAHEPARSQADWLTTSLCYAALAGSPVEASRPGLEDGSSQPFAANLQIGQHGAATARFMQVEKGHSPQQWSLQYDRAGQLVKVTISPSGHFGVRGVPAH